MKNKLTPIGDRLLVEPVKQADRIGLLYIPDVAKEKPQECIVIELGSGELLNDGKRKPFDVKVGDRVIVGKYAGSEIKVNDTDYRLVDAEDVMGIISEVGK